MMQNQIATLARLEESMRDAISSAQDPWTVTGLWAIIGLMVDDVAAERLEQLVDAECDF